MNIKNGKVMKNGNQDSWDKMNCPNCSGRMHIAGYTMQCESCGREVAILKDKKF